MNNHIVIIGWDYFIKSIVMQLVKARQDIMVITNNPKHEDILNDFDDTNKPSLLISSFHDYKNLSKANIEHSKVVLVNLQDDTKNLVFVLKLKRLFPDVQIIVPINNTELRETFVKAGITYSLSRAEICAKLFASHLFEKNVAEYMDDLLASGGEGTTEHDIQQYLMTDHSPVIGMSYQDVFVRLKNEFNTILIGICKSDTEGNRILHKNPYGDIRIEQDDFLVLICNGASSEKITRFFGVEEGV